MRTEVGNGWDTGRKGIIIKRLMVCISRPEERLRKTDGGKDLVTWVKSGRGAPWPDGSVGCGVSPYTKVLPVPSSVGKHTAGNGPMSLSHIKVSFSFFLSLKSINISLGEDLKNEKQKEVAEGLVPDCQKV